VAHRPQRCPDGFTLVEILIVLAMLSIVLAMGVPHLLAAHSQLRVNLAAAEAASEIRLAGMRRLRSI
jgi:prepilin-type N-terminal cleavage/methylation domain-containing protein